MRSREGPLRRIPKFPAIFLCLAVFVLSLAWSLDIRLNLTASFPLGLYIATDQPTDYVAFCLSGEAERIALARQYITPGHCPGGGTPLLKQVVARPGDIVRLDERGIAVNGRLLPRTYPRLRDTLGRPLQVYPSGTYNVPHGLFWVVSSYNSLSLDSRYYGPIPSAAIRFHLRPLCIKQDDLNAPGRTDSQAKEDGRPVGR